MSNIADCAIHLSHVQCLFRHRARLYRFRPEEYASGESGLIIDSVTPGPDNSGTNGSSQLTDSPRFMNAEPLRTVQEFAMNEDRYADLNLAHLVKAGILRPELQTGCNQEQDALKYRVKRP